MKKFPIDIEKSGIEIENEEEIILAIKIKLNEIFPQAEWKNNVIILNDYEDYLKACDIITNAKIKLISLND